MLDKVRGYTEKWHMLQTEDCVIVGVSGGADSICLLLLLIELQKEKGFRLIAAHVNHGLRGQEAKEDEAYVKHFCEERGILCETYFANVELIAKNRKQSTEEAGREVRRAFFGQLLDKHQGTKIALAHHQNDNAETFFLNLARGTGMKGLGGISPVNGVIIRPLLCVDRGEIESYLQEKGIAYCQDKTNASDEYTRNRVRNHVMPFMQENINPKFVEHINETMEQVRQVQEYLETQMETFWMDCVEECQGGYVVSKEEYDVVPNVLKPMLLKKILADVSGHEKDLEAIHLRQLQELFEKQSGKKIDLPYQMEGKRIYAGVKIVRKAEEAREPEISYLDFQKTEQVVSRGRQKIFCRILKKDEIKYKSLEKSSTRWFDYDIIKDNICFRTRRQGDYITIHPDGRTQKLKSYFINEKIPQEERDNILLLAEGSHVLWIVGYRHSCAYEITSSTKHILEVQIREESEGEKDGRDN